MLMFGGEAKPPALGNFFYSPLRLRPVLEPAAIHSALPTSPPVNRRRKKESPLDPQMDLRPGDSPRTSEEDSPLAKLLSRRDTGDESDEGEEDKEPEPKEKKKKKKHRKSKKKDKASETLDKICRKLKLPYVLGFLGIFVLLACGFIVFLKNRLIACCKRCWPFKRRNKKSNKDMFNLEGGDSPILSRRSLKSKKKGAAGKTVDTGVPDSRTSLTKSPAEDSKVGCSPCCRKKKKKDKKRRK